MASASKVVVFWTDEKTHSWIQSEFLQGRLRQGWGQPTLQLTENGIIVPFALWARRFILVAKSWGHVITVDNCKTRYSILARMLALKRGDLVLVPRMAHEGEFCIVRVGDGYIFDESQFDRVKDFGHVLRIDKESIKNYRNGSSKEAAAIAVKLRHYRSAVSNVADEVWAGRISALYESTL